ncbi:60S ribosomal protein L7 [Nosema granulosis]|uniref:60S ribosomal protein L7 n=1 Tax=Nosema granulosis TaxID=83296 RepID=A0A9P6H1A5_9MICR|nr:60S ribosomal protein L7 [Nosema granulosis]
MSQSETAVPFSVQRKQEYTEKKNKIIQEKREQFENRVAENAKYAQETTEKLLNFYYSHEKAIEKKKAELEAKNMIYVPSEPEFLVVMKLRSSLRAPPKQRKILELLRLKRMNSLVFVKNNKSTRRMLQLAKDYVSFGTISYELLRELIYKRAVCRINNINTKLSNETIDLAFGGEIRCIEEIVHSIYFGTSLFKDANNFLCPIALHAPIGGFKGRKSKSFMEGGCMGNHHDLIGEIISKMI